MAKLYRLQVEIYTYSYGYVYGQSNDKLLIMLYDYSKGQAVAYSLKK